MTPSALALHPSFAVMAETHEGNVFTLRAGFGTQGAAEDHPVKLKLWKRVWVEPVKPPPIPEDKPPPMPWSVCWEGRHAYITDFNGKRIGVLLGTVAQRKHMEAKIEELMNDHLDCYRRGE